MIRRLFNFIMLSICFVFSCASTQSGELNTVQSLSTEDCAELHKLKVITHANPVPCARLNKVSFRYLGEGNQIKDDGEMVVLDTLAPNIVSLMQQLLKNNFVIAKAIPMQAYDGDDDASMADNNSSAFNGRAITGGKSWSIHAYGAALDINPIQNPFIDIEKNGMVKISPPASAFAYVNRLQSRPGKPQRSGMAEDAVIVFAEYGFFTWGGHWNYPIDYQHFQVGPRSFVKKLAGLSRKQGKKLLDFYISLYKNCQHKNNPKKDKLQVHAMCIEQVLAAMS